MSSVSTSAAFSSSINLNVIDGQVFEVFNVGISLKIVD
jgi:hypothetical protein